MLNAYACVTLIRINALVLTIYMYNILYIYIYIYIYIPFCLLRTLRTAYLTNISLRI